MDEWKCIGVVRNVDKWKSGLKMEKLKGYGSDRWRWMQDSTSEKGG